MSWSRGRGGGGGGCRSINLLTAGYRSRVTGGAGGVSLRAAGEQHTHVGDEGRIIVPGIETTVSICGAQILTVSFLLKQNKISVGP